MELPEWLEDKAEMVLVVEMTKEAETVKFIVVIGVIQSLQELQFLQTSLVPEKYQHVFQLV